MPTLIDQLATYHTVSDILEEHNIDPRLVLEWLVDEGLLDLAHYNEETEEE